MKRNIIILVFLIAFVGTAEAQFVQTVVSLTGNVFNKVNKDPETVALLVLKDGKRVTATRSNASENGFYYLTGLKSGETYELQLKKKGFMNKSMTLEIPKTDKYAEISRDFLISPKEIGTKIPLEVPPFEYNKSKIRFGADIFLEDLKNTLELNPEVKIEILCYADNNSNKQENTTLTKERAESIKAYFVSEGITPDRITINGVPSTDPDNPPPIRKLAKGKRYIGTSYLKITSL